MSNKLADPYKPKPESTRPWNDAIGYHSTFYPNIWGKKNAFTIFSPAADRFLLVDDLDLFLVHETARILSSKVSTITYILDRNQPEAQNMDNTNCLEYSTRHKKESAEFGSIAPLRHKQTATLRKIQIENIVYCAGWSPEYSTVERKDKLLELHEYATFVLRTLHAIRLAEETSNYFPEASYAESYFEGLVPDNFRVLYDGDGSTAPRGMKHEICKILYHSNTIEQALEEIHNAWRTYSSNSVVSIRRQFYFCWGIDEPADLLAVHYNGFWNKEVHNKTSWVL
jgi:hypothetical protein